MSSLEPSPPCCVLTIRPSLRICFLLGRPHAGEITLPGQRWNASEKLRSGKLVCEDEYGLRRPLSDSVSTRATGGTVRRPCAMPAKKNAQAWELPGARSLHSTGASADVLTHADDRADDRTRQSQLLSFAISAAPCSPPQALRPRPAPAATCSRSPPRPSSAASVGHARQSAGPSRSGQASPSTAARSPERTPSASARLGLRSRPRTAGMVGYASCSSPRSATPTTPARRWSSAPRRSCC